MCRQTNAPAQDTGWMCNTLWRTMPFWLYTRNPAPPSGPTQNMHSSASAATEPGATAAVVATSNALSIALSIASCDASCDSAKRLFSLSLARYLRIDLALVMRWAFALSFSHAYVGGGPLRFGGPLFSICFCFQFWYHRLRCSTYSGLWVYSLFSACDMMRCVAPRPVWRPECAQAAQACCISERAA